MKAIIKRLESTGEPYDYRTIDMLEQRLRDAERIIDDIERTAMESSHYSPESNPLTLKFKRLREQLFD